MPFEIPCCAPPISGHLYFLENKNRQVTPVTRFYLILIGDQNWKVKNIVEEKSVIVTGKSLKSV